jgi:glycosyltransferase involved in cell wall biosynthesis
VPLRQVLNRIRWRLRATRHLWRRGGASEISALAGDVPLGRLDAPEHRSTLPGSVTVRGWALFPSGPPARVEVRLGERSLGRARLGLARPDIGTLTALPGGAVSGFELIADLSDQTGPEKVTLHVLAIGAAGERLELGPLRVGVAADPGAEAPKPPAVRPAAADEAGRGSGRRLLVFTHQLDAGGAQTFLVQLIRGMLARGSFEPTVVSALNGPLRGELEELGVRVHTGIGSPIYDLESHLDRVEELTAWASPLGFDAVLVNTASPLASPGAEVAERLGIPAIWAIHESFPPAVLWAELDSGVRALSEAALSNAAFAVFEAEATQRLYEDAVGAERCLTVPYGLDIEPIDAERKGFDREEARRAAGIDAGAEVVLCVGSIEPRKAQVSLAQAFDLVAERHPRAQLAFLGARDNESSRLLADWAGSLRAANRIRLVPVTPEVGAWYGLSDLLVCASDIESLPRTVLEAMAWELPVLATSVFGLPELIDDGETGWLCADRDVEALAEALDRVLGVEPGQRISIGRNGRRRVEDRHALDSYCEEIEQLLDRAIEGQGVAGRARGAP